MPVDVKSPKNLIKFALPLDDINVASVRGKSIRPGRLSTLHLWWALRPLAATLEVLVAQIVNDQGCNAAQGFADAANKKGAAIKWKRFLATIWKLLEAGPHQQRGRAGRPPVSIAIWDNDCPGVIQRFAEAIHP